MKARLIAVLLLGLAGQAYAQTPTADQDAEETQFGAEARLQREHLAESCGALNKFLSCATSLITGHPFHLSVGSIAPQNGFGLGPAVVTHFTPENWRLTWSGDAVFAPGGSSRAGTYLKIFRTKIEPPRLDTSGGPARPLRLTEYPVYNVYAQRISLPSLSFYGTGPETSVDDRVNYGMAETTIGGNAAIPFSAAVAPLRLSVFLEANARLFDIRDEAADDVPGIGSRFTELTAPGLATEPSFAQFGEGLKMRPWLFNDRLQLDYAFLYQQYVSGESSSSFRRWTIDLKHQIPLYRTGGGPAQRNEQNTPNECSVSQSVHECPSVTRDRWGSISVRALISKSQVGDGGGVPFYLQRVLGGSDLNGQRALASYDDYRFTGPHLLLFQQTIEHAVWGPIGATAMFEQGHVASQAGSLSFSDLRHSVGVGATVRAGGFPMLSASWHTGGAEGRHFIMTIDTALLGGGGRPSLP